MPRWLSRECRHGFLADLILKFANIFRYLFGGIATLALPTRHPTAVTMVRASLICSSLLLAGFTAASEAGDFTILSMNVAGLLAILQSNDVPGDKTTNARLIGTYFAKYGYDVIHVQEVSVWQIGPFIVISTRDMTLAWTVWNKFKVSRFQDLPICLKSFCTISHTRIVTDRINRISTTTLTSMRRILTHIGLPHRAAPQLDPASILSLISTGSISLASSGTIALMLLGPTV
jgi:hypothetical protein